MKILREVFRIIRTGFHHGLRQCGITIPNKKLPVELWKWQTMEDEDMCEDCLERSRWPAMDIADWMKEGLPGTPEAKTQCQENCRCGLVVVDQKKSLLPHRRKQEII